MTTFNMRILDMLKQAQTGGQAGNEALFAQQTTLQRSAIGRASAPTPEELRVLSPSQQSAVRSGQVSALEPEIDAVGAKIKAQDARLQNFESSLDKIRALGQDIQDSIKIQTPPEVLNGYINMLRAGGNPTSVPTEVRDKVFAAMTDEDWKTNALAASGGDDPDYVIGLRKDYPDAGILATDTPQQAEAKLKNSRIYQDKVRGPVGTQADRDKSAVSEYTEKLNLVKGLDGFVSPSDYIAAKTKWVGERRSSASFDVYFNVYVDPRHPADYGVSFQTKPSGNQSTNPFPLVPEGG